MPFALIASLAAHALLALWLFDSPGSSKDLEAQKTVTIEIVEKTRPVVGMKDSRKGSRTRRKGGARTGALRHFGVVSRDFGLAARMAKGDVANRLEGDTSGWSPEQWGSGGGGGMAVIANAFKYERLVAEIEDMLNYPAALGRREIEGTINARLRFDSNGHCSWPQTRVTGVNPYLRAYIVAILHKLCSFDWMEQIAFAENQVVDLSFAFLITNQTGHAEIERARGQVAGNVLFFTRTFPRDDTQVHLGPVVWSLMTPGMFYLDPTWVVEHWDQWVNHQDPLREFQLAR